VDYFKVPLKKLEFSLLEMGAVKTVTVVCDGRSTHIN